MASRLLLLLIVVGCTRATLESSVADKYGGKGETTEMDFWDALSTQRAVSNHDAMHALLLSFGETPAEGYDSHAGMSRDRGWLKDGEKPPPNETARVGWIAKVVVIETGIKGGLTLNVFGPSERYAVQELNYMEWLPEMSPQQAISGARLIALLSQAEDYVTDADPEPREDM